MTVAPARAPRTRTVSARCQDQEFSKRQTLRALRSRTWHGQPLCTSPRPITTPTVTAMEPPSASAGHKAGHRKPLEVRVRYASALEVLAMKPPTVFLGEMTNLEVERSEERRVGKECRSPWWRD